MNNSLSQSAITSLNPRHFELIIYPTEQCNFRCSYCYEDFEIGRMSDNVIKGIKELISKRVENLDSFHLSWFGGEPLVAKDIVLDLSQYAFSVCEEKGVEFSGFFTTNGYHLTPQLARALSSLHQRGYQISLDGYGDGHNQTRKLASGKGTFNKIWKNLLDLQKSDIDFNIILRLHLTRVNLASVRELAYHIKNTFLSDTRFSVYLKAVGNWGGDNKILDQLMGKSERDSAIAEIKNILFQESMGAKNNFSLDETYICYASKPNSLAIRANGLVQKCTVMLADARNTVGEISIDGSLNLNPDLMRMWIRGYANEDIATLGCPASKLPQLPSTAHDSLKLIHSVAI